MNSIIIEKLNSGFAQYLIFSVTTESPLFALDDIAKHTSFVDGDVIIFDQLLQTGNSDNRFMTLIYKNGTFDYSTIRHLKSEEVESGIRNKIAEYLRSNTLLLKYSILLSQQKECILNGGII